MEAEISLEDIQNNQFSFSIKRIEDCNHSEECFSSQGLHPHRSYIMYIIEKGKGIHTIDFHNYKVCDQCAFFLTPGQVHAFNPIHVSGYYIWFNLEFYHSVKSMIKLYDFPFFHSSLTLPFLDLKDHFIPINLLLEQLFNEFQTNKFGKWSFLRAGLEMLLIRLTRVKQLEENQEFQPILIPNNEKVRALDFLIDQNFIEHKNIEFYANHLNLSARHLNNIIKNTTGQSISDMLHNRILTEAKRLLMNSEKSVAEIAYILNFSDKAYFHRYFKKHTGTTPIEFRKHFLKVHH